MTSPQPLQWYPSQTFGETPGSAYPKDWTPEDITRWIKNADQQIAIKTKAWEQTSGLDRQKLEAEIKDIADGRKQALELAQLQERTSRYGTDVASRDRMMALQQTMHQFEATHQLDQQKFGLDYAKAETDYLSSPDRYAQGTDFRNAASRMIAGQGIQPYGQGTTFTPKTPEQFAVLNNYPGSGANGAAQAQAAGGGGGGKDPRVQALTSMVKALPPSESGGMDQNDYAVMKAAEALYTTNLRPGALQQMRPDQKAILGSYIKKSGRSVNDWNAQQVRQGVGQGSSRAA